MTREVNPDSQWVQVSYVLFFVKFMPFFIFVDYPYALCHISVIKNPFQLNIKEYFMLKNVYLMNQMFKSNCSYWEAHHSK